MQTLRVLPCERERIIRNIDPENFRSRKLCSQAQRDYATAGSHIDNSRFVLFAFGFYQLNEFFGFRTRHHGAFIAVEKVAAEFNRAEQMLKRLPFSATLDEFPQGREFRFREHTLEFQI